MHIIMSATFTERIVLAVAVTHLPDLAHILILQFESLKAEDPTSGPMIIQDLMDYIGIHKVCTFFGDFNHAAVANFVPPQSSAQASVVGVNCGAILSSVFTIRFPGL